MREFRRDVSQRQHNDDRVRRAESWLKRSEELAKKEDGDTFTYERFVFLWIALNAAYEDRGKTGEDSDDREIDKIKHFLKKTRKRGFNQSIRSSLWKKCSDPIRLVMKNHYVYRSFWRWVENGYTSWEDGFEAENEKIESILGKNPEELSGDEIQEALMKVFERLYQLRNQIVHGGSTCASKRDESFGWSQVDAGCQIMSLLVPTILQIVRDEIDKNDDSLTWGKVAYPRVEVPDKGMSEGIGSR